MTGTREYKIWSEIVQRCENPKSLSYYRYGGRGINVCIDWRKSFMSFYTDMGKRPFKNAEIDRVDNDGNYCKENCRWTDRATNIRNSSISKLTIEEVNEIRILCAIGGMKQNRIADVYRVTPTTVNYIHKVKIWKDRKRK